MNSPHAGLVCPSCRVSLVMSERAGIEIDYCPQCRGIWLDRGELDKIIEKSARESVAAAPAPVPPPQQQTGYQQQAGYHPQQQGYDPRYDQSYGHGYQKRKKSFLEELFD